MGCVTEQTFGIFGCLCSTCVSWCVSLSCSKMLPRRHGQGGRWALRISGPTVPHPASIWDCTKEPFYHALFSCSCKFFKWNLFTFEVLNIDLHNSSINYETNLLKLINLSLVNVYCSNLVSNHSLIRLIRFISQFTSKLCNLFFISSRFNTPCM